MFLNSNDQVIWNAKLRRYELDNTISAQTMIKTFAAICFCLTASLEICQAEAVSKQALFAPGEGDSWAAGSLHHLQWNSEQSKSLKEVKAEYTIDDGASWSEVIAITSAGDKILWQVPNRPSERCRVKIIGQEGESVESGSFSIIPSQEVLGYMWWNVTKKAPYAARDGAGALVFKNKMWLIGGWNPGDKVHFPRITNNEVWSTTDGVAWELVKPNTFLDRNFDPSSDWEGRHTGGYVVYRDKMWLVGGDANLGHYQNDVWNSSDGKNWNYVNRQRDVPWGPRMLHYTLVFKDKIWVMGGQTLPSFAPSKEVFYRDIWNSADGVNWTELKPREPYWTTRGMISGSVVFRDRMWILGGGTYDTPTTPTRTFLNDVWSSEDGVDWERHVEFAPWHPRQYHSVAVFDDRMWVLGGYNNGDRNDVWYSSDGVNWYPLRSTPWAPRHATSVFVYDNAVWIAAGSYMGVDVWKLERLEVTTDGSESPTVIPGLLKNVALGLQGFGNKTVYVYDAKNPDKSPYPLNMSEGQTLTTPIYSTTFGLNFFGLGGKNTYAQLSLSQDGNIRFDKWKDGGDGLEILIDNEANPPTVIARPTRK